MKIFHSKRLVLCALLVGLCCTSCVGPFNATRRIHTWNREFDNRWLGEGVFLVFRALPVYGAAAVGDLFIFNSFQFWGAENPIDPVDPARIKALNAADDARAAGVEPEQGPDEETAE